MKNTRRDFLKMTTVGLAGCMIPSLATATTVKKGVSARSSVYDSVQYDVEEEEGNTEENGFAFAGLGGLFKKD